MLLFIHLVIELTAYPFGRSLGSNMCVLSCLFAATCLPVVAAESERAGREPSARKAWFKSSANSAQPVHHHPTGSPKTSGRSVCFQSPEGDLCRHCNSHAQRSNQCGRFHHRAWADRDDSALWGSHDCLVHLVRYLDSYLVWKADFKSLGFIYTEPGRWHG